MTNRAAATRLRMKCRMTRILPRTVMVLPPYGTSVAKHTDGTHRLPRVPRDMRGGTMPRSILLVNASSRIRAAVKAFDLILQQTMALGKVLNLDVAVDEQ